MAKSKLVKVNEKIADNVVGGYKKIEEGVVGGYKKIEEGAVGGFNKIADKFVDNQLFNKGRRVCGRSKRTISRRTESKRRSRESTARRTFGTSERYC